MNPTTLNTLPQNKIKILDALQRPLQDLRISVIDQCNLRCPYCMPEKFSRNHATFLRQQDWLTFDQIVTLVKAFVANGVRKCRLTGGEPMLRPNLAELIKRLSKIEGLEDIALTTNGTLLDETSARALKQAGLNRLTFSCDTLNPITFEKMCGHKTTLQRVLKSITAAEKAGFTPLKINVVLQIGLNENDCLALVKHFKNSGHILRFIEYMDVGNCNEWNLNQVIPSTKTFHTISAQYPLISLDENYFGEVAKRYRFKDGKGEIGFISSITQPFCQTCTRARLSVSGKLLPCLFSDKGIDLKMALEKGTSISGLRIMIKQIWNKREDRYSELRGDLLNTNQPKPNKVEMFQIGG